MTDLLIDINQNLMRGPINIGCLFFETKLIFILKGKESNDGFKVLHICVGIS